MARVKARAYASPTLVLLAFDWPEATEREDFLGFAIRRKPGFRGQPESWLPNRLTFGGAAREDEDVGSDKCPIQKFLWWDARIDDEHRGTDVTYWVAAVVGAADAPEILAGSEAKIGVAIPRVVEGAIGTYFNRAVVSSQAFSRQFGEDLEGEKLDQALKWLANGMETAVPDFLARSPAAEGAIYHLSDEHWVIPALKAFSGSGSLVYHSTDKDDSNDEVVKELKDTGHWECSPRTRANIMHNKFLVRVEDGEPRAVLMGSANFTTPGIATQANVIHTFESPKLARAYLARKHQLDGDPSLAECAGEAGWSEPIKVGDARIRVFFSPEPREDRESIDTIVTAIRRARSSVLFCLFMPTDRALRAAAFESGDRGRMMFGLVNTIPLEEPEEGGDSSAQAKVELYHRSRRNKDVFSHSLFARGTEPEGFWWEVANLPGQGGRFPVWIHHKFVVIDAETNDPVIYTGSANMSKNALHRNDENLLEIRGSRKLGAMYLAEGLRLYEHYRARAQRGQWAKRPEKYALRKNSSWARKYFVKGSPEAKARAALTGLA